MKKNILLLLILSSFTLSFSQTRGEKSDLNMLKSLFKKMKHLKINSDDTLLWTYTYTDTSITKLEKLADVFKSRGLTVVEIKTSKYDPQKRELVISEEKKYSVETLYEQVKSLNNTARQAQLDDYQARISGEQRKKEVATIIFKPVG